MPVRYFPSGFAAGGQLIEQPGSPQIRYPMSHISENFGLRIITRIYAVEKGEYRAIGLNSGDPNFSAYLVSQNIIRQNAAFDYVKRVYAEIPQSHVDWDEQSVTFPAYTYFGGGSSAIRTQYTETVPVRISYQYQLTNSPDTAFALEDAFSPEWDYNANNFYKTIYVLDSSGDVSGSIPSLSSYQGKVSAGEYIKTQADSIERWLGNIWRKITVETKAR